MGSVSRSDNLQRLEEAKIRLKLQAIEDDPMLYDVKSSYSSDSEKYPDHKMPFSDKHYNYLLSHPDVDPEQYLANLRLMLRR